MFLRVKNTLKNNQYHTFKYLINKLNDTKIITNIKWKD